MEIFTILKYSNIKTSSENKRPPTTGGGIQSL